MAIVEVKVPQLSESVAEATLLQWKKKPGEAVAIDEILIEIETDKVVLEVPAPGCRRAGRDRGRPTAPPSSPTSDREDRHRRQGRCGRTGGSACSRSGAGARSGSRCRAGRRLEVRCGHARGRQAPGRQQADDRLTWPAPARTAASPRATCSARSPPAPRPRWRRPWRSRTGAPKTALPQVAAPARAPDLGDRPEAARADEPPARPHRRAPAAVAIDQRHPDHLQRSEHGAGDGNAQALPGEVREGARRQDRLHDLLREGRGARAEEVPGDQRLASTATTSSTTATSTSASPSVRRAAWWCRSCAMPTR